MAILAAPSYMNREQQLAFKDLVRQMEALKIIKKADRYQIEMAACLIVKTREMHQLLPGLDARDKDDNRAITQYKGLIASLNMCLDKLCISNMRRNPDIEKRGRPEKSGFDQVKKTDRDQWLRAVK